MARNLGQPPIGSFQESHPRGRSWPPACDDLELRQADTITAQNEAEASAESGIWTLRVFGWLRVLDRETVGKKCQRSRRESHPDIPKFGTTNRKQ